MKYALLLLVLAAPSHAFDGPYFKGIWENGNYKTPYVSAGTNLTMKGNTDGQTVQTTLIWHPADPKNSLIPQSLQNVGVKSFSWSLLNCGGNFNFSSGSGSLVCGSSVNVAPTLLGPAAQLLEASSNAAASAVGTFIADDTNGNGLAIGYTWNMHPVNGGTIEPFDRWGTHLDAFIGVGYTFP